MRALHRTRVRVGKAAPARLHLEQMRSAGSVGCGSVLSGLFAVVLLGAFAVPCGAQTGAEGPRGNGLDVEAERAYMRTGGGEGAEVPVPSAGQQVVFHVDWRVNGNGAPATIGLHAVLDGDLFCSTTASVSGPDLFTTFCNAAWIATGGTHTLRWTLDATDAVDEPNEVNNTALVMWSTGNPTATVSSSDAPGPTRTATPALPDTPPPTQVLPSPTPGASPTHAPAASPTSIAETPPPTATNPPGVVDHAYARGDANCSVLRSAADVVAQLVALGGDTICDNDDCDLDGDVDADDVDCAARCLFGSCPVPPHAPRIVEVAAESAAAIAAFSVVRIDAENLGEEQDFQTARVGGMAATVLDYAPPGTLRVLVPAIDPGPAELVVSRGGLDSVPFAVVVAAPAPIGPFDDIEPLFALADALLADAAALDLDSIYGDSAATIRNEIEHTRSDLAGARQALLDDPGFTPEVRTAIAAAVDASGIPERLRAILDVAAVGRSSAAPADRMQDLADGANAAGALTEEVGLAQDLEPAREAARTLRFFHSIASWFDPLRLLRIIPPIPEPGRTVEVQGDGLGFDVDLVIQHDAKTWRVSPTGRTETGFLYALPHGRGFCGEVNIVLRRDEEASNDQRIDVRPVLDAIPSKFGRFDGDVIATTQGVSGCFGSALFTRLPPGCLVQGLRNVAEVDGGPDKSRIPLAQLFLPPDDYDLRLIVDRRMSASTRVALDSPIRGLEVECRRESCTGDASECEVLVPGNVECVVHSMEPATFPGVDMRVFANERFDLLFPPCAREFIWSLTGDSAQIENTLTESNRNVLTATRVGSAQLSVLLQTDLEIFVAETSPPYELEISDVEPPLVGLEVLSPPLECSDDVCRGEIRLGEEIRARVVARDDAGLATIGIKDFGVSVEDASDDDQAFAETRIPCLLDPGACNETSCLCDGTVSVVVSESFVGTGFYLAGVATDLSGNHGTSTRILFGVRGPGNVSGRVTDETTGEALAGVPVFLYATAISAVVAVTESGEDGGYMFTDVPSDIYTVAVPAGTYRVGGGDVDFAAASRPVLVIAGGTVERDLLLARRAAGRSVTGIVLDAGTGRGFGGAAISAEISPDSLETGYAVTGTDGRFAIEGLADGVYRLGAGAEGFARVEVRFDVPGVGIGNIVLHPANEQCGSGLFSRVLSGSPRTFGTPLRFGPRFPALVSFDDPPGTFRYSESAAMLCVTRPQGGQVTFRWNTEWLTNVRLLSVGEVGPSGGVTTVFNVFAEENDLQPPIEFGDTSQGRPGVIPDGDVRAGREYQLSVTGQQQATLRFIPN
jgi:hypothetical protein